MGRIFKHLFYAMVIITILIVVITLFTLSNFNKHLPNHKELATYQPKTMSRLYSNDGLLVKEFATEKRIFIPISSIPKIVIDAFIAAEDKNFYTHHGIDPYGVLRAAYYNLTSNKSLQGGSTINQQVAKNILLSHERTLTRKIKEAILAIRINNSFTKEKILELYLNEIYLGDGAYGVAAAALNYFNKPITQINIQEAALLAAMPKAPSTYNPRQNYNQALERRNLVLKRMESEKFISNYVYQQLIKSPIELLKYKRTTSNSAQSYTDEILKIIEQHFSKQAVYEDGFTIHSTLDVDMQNKGQDALRKALFEYSTRRGYIGAVAHLNSIDNWQNKLQDIKRPDGLKQWELAIILNINNKLQHIEIGMKNNKLSYIDFADIQWTKKDYHNKNSNQDDFKNIFNQGDIIIVEPTENAQKYHLRQIPKVNGALVAMNPQNGHIKAMIGGFSSKNSQFNRATQAKRQPGSAFKPFIYLSALENSYTAADLINDEPIEFNNKTGKLHDKRLNNETTDWTKEVEEEANIWAPQNHSGNFYGPTTLRIALEKSRNVSTVHLGMALGIDKIVEITKRFNINNHPPHNLSTVLGTAETTLLKMVNAYGMIANGGYKIQPQMIDRIQDRRGKIVYSSNLDECLKCNVNSIFDNDFATPPDIITQKQQVTSPASAYQLTTILQGVIERGTAKKAKILDMEIAGKTGTTQNSRDSWFIGYTNNLVVGVYVGFDDAASLGQWEEGSTIALPAFINFMQDISASNQNLPFIIPEDIQLVKIDAKTGYLPSKQTPNEDIILEAFKSGTEPKTIKLRNQPLPVVNKDIQNIPIEQLPTNAIY